jgi:serine/threonine protein kinase
MAPEIVRRTPYDPIAADLWALGVLFYVMLQGNYPFRASKEEVLFKKIEQGGFRFIADVSERSRALISRLIMVRPSDRVRLCELMEASWQDWLEERVAEEL